MKKLALAILILSSAAVADEGPSFKVILRETISNRTFFAPMPMVDLESSNSFDGKYFKIVYAKGKDAISFNEKDEDTVLRAASTYYHLNEARKYWVEKLGSEAAKNLPKTTVRLNVMNQFDDLGHFANDNRSPQYNNALSVPAGETPEWVPDEHKDKWGNEIWFRPVKKILSTDLGPLPPNPVTLSLMAIKRPVINYIKNQMQQRLLEELFFRSFISTSIQQDVLKWAGTYAVFTIAMHESYRADYLFMNKYYFLDTAMVPEIAFHEYSHVVLSDSLAMTHSTPVVEGMADYFATVIADKRKVYAPVPGYSNSVAKDRQEKKKYAHWEESNRNAEGDFTLSVLWDVREALGAEYGDKVVYEARKYLKTETSDISHGLLSAILTACDVKCEMPRRDKYKLYDAFNWRGF